MQNPMDFQKGLIGLTTKRRTDLVKEAYNTSYFQKAVLQIGSYLIILAEAKFHVVVIYWPYMGFVPSKQDYRFFCQELSGEE